MKNTNALIIALIKEDIKCQKLLRGLAVAGALADDYFINLDQIIVEAMDAPEDAKEKLLLKYETLLRSSLAASDNLDDLALEIYSAMLAEKKLRALSA